MGGGPGDDGLACVDRLALTGQEGEAPAPQTHGVQPQVDQDTAPLIGGDDVGVGVDLGNGPADRGQGRHLLTASTIRGDGHSRADDPA